MRISQSSSFLAIAGSLAVAVLVSACGDDSSTEPVYVPRKMASLTAEERALYCFLDVAPERDDAKRTAVLAALRGSWQHYPVANDDTRRTFKLDLDRKVTTISEYTGVTNITDIYFGKLCLSQPLGAELGPYAGYRIVEMMSRENEGAAALAIRIDPPAGGNSSPTLNLSDYYYQRFAAKNETLARISTMLDTTRPGHRIWVYPSHQD